MTRARDATFLQHSRQISTAIATTKRRNWRLACHPYVDAVGGAVQTTMERTEVLEMMGELKLYGMKSAYDEIYTTAVKRQHEPQQLVGDLLKEEISEKHHRWIAGGGSRLHLTSRPRWRNPARPFLWYAGAAPGRQRAAAGREREPPRRAIAFVRAHREESRDAT